MSQNDVERIAQAVLARLGGEQQFETPRGARLPQAPEGRPTVDYCALCVEQEQQRTRTRAILTTTGRNRKGIVARLTQQIADVGGDILDISQTLVSDYFTMIIIVDVSKLEVSFAQFKEQLQAACRDLELESTIIHEEVIRAFQRI